MENEVQMEKRKCCDIFCRSGFKWRKGSVEAFSGERGSNGEKETRGVFWRTGFIMAITSYRQATGVQMEKRRHEVFSGEWGSLFWQTKYRVRMQ